uniref:NADH-ubiquinone oxidoreductase chain 5 n=1 Tax=Zygeupolia rubens TaxID=166045 RepID=I1SR60_9BILA|nr:NADH dehydrogenase subunit 5 [Zygeupolia rubens]ADZ05380.1 NADH dehydrogenase subunit 5 [Zygeupolia rubens]
MWWSRYVSGNLSVLLFGVFLFLFWFFLSLVSKGVVVYMSWELFNVGVGVMEFNLVFDWVSLSFGCVVVLISACVLMFACEYMVEDIFLSRFSWLVFLFVLSMNFVIFIPNLVSILLGWDGLGLVSFLLVIYYQNYKSLAGGMITVLMNRIGDVAILLSIGLVCKEGTWGFFYFSFSDDLKLVCLFLLVAGMTKSAQVPFSSWLPAAMAAPTPVSALVHSSTLVTAGVFPLIRFYSFLSQVWWFQVALLIIASMTMLMAGIAANVETDLKKIIALSTLSQLGVMMGSLGIGAWELALFHLYTHALFKALLFLCAGVFIHRSQHGQDLRMSGMVWNRLPVIVSCIHVSNLSLCGAPFLAGFYSKDLILESSFYGGFSFLILFMFFFATGLTVSYSFRFSYFVLWGSYNFYSMSNWKDELVVEVFPALVLVFGAVVGGSFFSWVLFYGEGVVFLSFLDKIFTLMVVMVGVLVGWFVVGMSSFVSLKDSFFGSKTYFGFIYMWFLTYLSGQGVIKSTIRSGSSMLYQVDRGWLEVLGGEGSLMFVKDMVVRAQGYNYNSVLVYLSLMIFVVGVSGILLIVF